LLGNVKIVDRACGAVGHESYAMLDLGNPTPLEDANFLADALANYGVAFLEEPLSPGDQDGFAALTARANPQKIGLTSQRILVFEGQLTVLDKPGLGIELIEDTVAEFGISQEKLEVRQFSENVELGRS
jgi:L-alanine-DL-glutamate epimerase-like enolase superfamily enzyme